MARGTSGGGTLADLEGTTVAVYGLGKLGLPVAAVFADFGADVIGVDIDEQVVDAVNDGRSPVDGEPGLPELVDAYSGEGLSATTDGRDAARRADVMTVVVPTLVDDEKNASLGPVIDVAQDIRDGVSHGDLVVLESTVPPGTTDGPFLDAVTAGDLTVGEDFHVAHCPERTSSGRAIQDLTVSYPKIVGGIDEASTRTAASLYRTINEPGVIELDSATAAEAVKVFEGVYRDTNIALANELAKACEEWGLDSAAVFEAANTQPYCDIHTPGIGVGGHCIPVYPHFVIERATEASLLEAARSVNDGMPAHAVGLLESTLESEGVSIADSNILVLGITYRPGVRETRYAPAVSVIEQLNAKGASVSAHDPLLGEPAIEGFGAVPVADPLAPTDLDGIVLATGHAEYADLDLEALCQRMRTPVLVDGRRFFDESDVLGFDYVAVGNGRSGAAD